MIYSTFQEESSRISVPNYSKPHMESIKRTAEIFNLPVHFVRTKVMSGEVVATRSGRRIFVNVDKFAEYLNSSTVQPITDTMSGAARVKPINLREVI